MNKKQLLRLACIFVILLTACGPRESTLTDSDQAAVLAFAEPKTDALLAGMNTNDYAAFSADFDEEMLNAMPQSGFESFKQERDETLGLYVAREVREVLESDGFYIVIYNAEFEKADSVTMRVVFRVAEPHEVSGLWFDQ